MLQVSDKTIFCLFFLRLTHYLKMSKAKSSKTKEIIGDDVPLSALKKKRRLADGTEAPSFKKGGFLSTLLLHQNYINEEDVPGVLQLIKEGGMNVSLCACMSSADSCNYLSRGAY